MGEEIVYDLNRDKPTTFIKPYEGQNVDIFFTNDDRSAIVTQRMRNIVSHGKDGGKSMNLSKIKFVFCGIENEFYSVDDYKKLLKAVYSGKKAPIKPLTINESLNEGADTWVIYVEEDGKKTKVNEVPKAKLNTALFNIRNRYVDNDVIVAAMTSTDWEKLHKK